MFSWQTFLLGTILGIIQLGIGLWIGKIVYDRRKERRPNDFTDLSSAELQESAQQLQNATSRLQSTVSRVSGDVSNHQVRIEQMSREMHNLRNRSASITEEVLWERLNQMMKMTTDFSHRLSEAESQLKTQQKQIEALASGKPIETDASPVQNTPALAKNTASLDQQEDDVVAVLESVRSRLNEVVSPTTVENTN